MSLLEQMREKARQNKKTIVLPEGTEERTVKAVETIIKEGIADPILLGEPAEINAVAAKVGADISGAKIINPATAPELASYINTLYEMRKNKGMTEDKARQQLLDPLYYGSMMVQQGAAAGEVAGARNTTGDVLRPALQIIKPPGNHFGLRCLYYDCT
jgi:phosphate acetyltransferase